MDSDRKASLLIDLVIAFLGILAFLPYLLEVDIVSELFFDFHIASLVGHGQFAR